jgi:hypothetical protein
MAFIDVNIAMNSSPTRVAEAYVFIDLVDTLPIQTWIGSTLIDVFFTMQPSVSRATFAVITIQLVYAFTMDAWV